MSLPHISPADAKKLVDAGAVLIDIREAHERAHASIPGSAHLPLSRLGAAELDTSGAEKVVFFCKSGMRTASNAKALAGTTDCTAYILDGGIDKWRAVGLPIEAEAAPQAGAAATQPTAAAAPIDVVRQVQITAGLLVLAGTALGAYVSPLWYALPAAIGAGLILTGATGSCAMARILMRMPWNRATSAAKCGP